MAATILNGFFNLADFSIAYEMTIFIVREKNVGEATICGFINLLANAFGFAFIMGLTPLLNNE